MEEKRICQNKEFSKYCEREFTIVSEDFQFYEKMKVPPPTFCPTCRMIRRFNFRNEGMLFKRLDDYTREEIFSGYSSHAPIKTYENSYWYSDNWDKLGSGVDYDFSKPFFEQFQNLLKEAPIPAKSVYNMFNSTYVNEASGCKNVYLSFNADYMENSAYLRKMRQVKDSFDSYECEDIELCYECVTVNKSYRTFYSFGCDNCVDVYFSKNLKGCTNCFGCVNLRNKSYYFFNKPLTKEEYEDKIKQYINGSYSDLEKTKEEVKKFWELFPNKFYIGNKNTNSTGDRLFNTKNVGDSYFVRNAENVRFCQDVWAKTANCYDYSVWGDGAENIYECMTCGLGIFNLKYCFNCWENCYELEYCAYVLNSKNCFGCVGLYKNEYCILNKQYTKEEYEALLPRIKKHMVDMPYVDKKGRVYKYGEFFPQETSPTGYNESLANNFFPLTQEETEKNSYIFNPVIRKDYQITLFNTNIPNNINEVLDTILKEIIDCKSCRRPYNIISMELDFYRKMNLPVPRLCHDCRFLERFTLIKPPIFYKRKCMNQNCNTEFKTNYSSSDTEIIYCEKCYQQEVI